MTKLAPLTLSAAALALLPSGLCAQDPIEYDNGDYLYAETPAEAAPPTPDEAAAEGPGAARVIPTRRDAGATAFVPRPVVQPIPAVDPAAYTDAQVVHSALPQAPELETYAALPVEPAAPHVAPAAPHAAPAVYPYPAIYRDGAPNGGASRVIYGGGPISAPRDYTDISRDGYGAVPAGGQLVEFDREAWLAECRRRIAPQAVYDDGDDGALIGAVAGAAVGGLAGNRIAGRGNRTAGTLVGAGLGALGGAVAGRALDRGERAPEVDDSQQRCETYLDGYMASARSGGLHGQYSQSGQYMLVPVTVMVPQRAYYSDGTPVR